ncbi:hypothetical protein ACLKA6_001921 [Drosophila palustris]
MTLKCSLVLLLGLVIAVTGKLNVPKIQALKQQTTVLSEQNPKNAPGCFSVYIPRLDSISTQYELEITKCNKAFEEQIAVEDSYFSHHRSQLDRNGVDSCRAIIDCSSIVGYVEAFECFAKMGAEQSKSMLTLSANALQVAAELKESYQLFETKQTICLNNAEAKYVKDTTHEYEQLNSRLVYYSSYYPLYFYYQKTYSRLVYYSNNYY